MSQTFLTLKQELQDRLSLDQTVTANDTKLSRWFNLIQQDFASRTDWHWLENREIIQTNLQKTAGTVSINNGSTSVTGVGTAFAATDVNSYIQFQNSTNWYVISAFSSATSITLEEPYTETTISGGTYKVNQVYYDFSTSVDRVLDIRQSSSPYKLTNMGYRTLDIYEPDMQTMGPPTAYYLFRQDPSVAVNAAIKIQAAFFPIADANYNMECRTIKVISDLSNATDVPIIPQKWLPVLLDGAEWLGCKSLNDPKEGQQKQIYEAGVQRALSEELAFNDYHPVMQPSDSLRRTTWIPFPSTFENPQ